MRNHYVPRFVLRRFARNGVIHVYDKEADTIRQVSAGSSYVIRDFYHDDVEHLFAQIEGPLSAVLESILTSCRDNARFQVPDGRVLECCRQLLLLQLLRTPHAKQIGMRALDDVDTGELVARLASAGFPDIAEDTVAEIVDRWRDDGARDRGSTLWSLSLLNFMADPAKALPNVVPAVLNKGVILAKTRSAFVLGDRGAMSTATDKAPLTDPRSEIFFPVSPGIGISLAGKRDQIEVTTIETDHTRKINLSTVAHSQRWIASHSNALLKSLANPR